MRTPTDIITALTTSYDQAWRDWLTENRSTPRPRSIGAPSGKVITAQHERVAAWIDQWKAWVAKHPGTHLTDAAARTPFGDQYRPTHLHIDTYATLAGLISQADHWAMATARWQILTQEWPHALPALKPLLTGLIGLDAADFTILLDAAAWLRDNPRSGLMPRQVPVAGMHSKWVGSHRTQLLALLTTPGMGRAVTTGNLDATNETPIDPDEASAVDLDALGLRPRPHLIDVILADPDDRARLHGLHHLAAPAAELGALPLAPKIVLVVENKESALIIPDHPGLLVIHSLGEHVDALVRLPWIHNVTTIYWGDLDRAGMTILARARAIIPALSSALMDRQTLSRYRWLAVTDTTTARPAGPQLTPEEEATYAALADPLQEGVVQGPLRLEQERLPADTVIENLRERLRAG